MSYQALARKWRPGLFSEVVGQEHVVSALSNALDQDRVHHAFLFTGTRGVGKTTLARILAKALNCEQGLDSVPCNACDACRAIDEGRFVDLIEVDAASRTKVDDTRELLDNVQYAPTRGRYKIYLIDEVHMLSGHSFNALLKTLEEPPPHVKFLLATTDPQKLPVTVLSRCLQFNLKVLPPQQIVTQLQKVLTAEQVEFESEALVLLARVADGSMRDALSLLDQAIAHGGGVVATVGTRDMLGLIDTSFVRDLMEGLAGGDVAQVLATVQGMWDQACDYDNALDELLLALHQLALCQLAPEAWSVRHANEAWQQELAAKVTAEDLQLFYQIGLIGKRDLPLAPDPRSGFEMVLLRMLAFRPVSTAGEAAAEPTPAAEAPQVTVTAPAEASTPTPSGAAATWPTLLAAMPLTGLVRELAMNIVLERRDGQVFHFALDSRHDHLLTDERSKALAAALSVATGGSCQVKIKTGETTEETPAQHQQRVQRERQETAEQTIREDPDVQEVIAKFGATLLPETVKTRENS